MAKDKDVSRIASHRLIYLMFKSNGSHRCKFSNLFSLIFLRTGFRLFTNRFIENNRISKQSSSNHTVIEASPSTFVRWSRLMKLAICAFLDWIVWWNNWWWISKQSNWIALNSKFCPWDWKDSLRGCWEHAWVTARTRHRENYRFELRMITERFHRW